MHSVKQLNLYLASKHCFKYATIYFARFWVWVMHIGDGFIHIVETSLFINKRHPNILSKVRDLWWTQTLYRLNHELQLFIDF